MAEGTGRSLHSARFAFQEYGEDKPPVLNTIITDEYNEFAYTIDMIRRSFESFDDYLKDSGAGLGRFLDVVDVFSGDLISLGGDFQEGIAAFRKSLTQSVAFGNLTEGGQSKFLDQFGETVGAVVSQLAGGSGLLGGASAGGGGILGSLISGARPVGQAIGASLLPVVTEGVRSMFAGAEETQTEATEAATGAMGGRRLNVRQTYNHIGQVVVEVDAILYSLYSCIASQRRRSAPSGLRWTVHGLSVREYMPSPSVVTSSKRSSSALTLVQINCNSTLDSVAMWSRLIFPIMGSVLLSG